jgi:hypothetical protein
MHLKWVSSSGESTPYPTTPIWVARLLPLSQMMGRGADSVYYMGTLEGRWKSTGMYLRSKRGAAVSGRGWQQTTTYVTL